MCHWFDESQKLSGELMKEGLSIKNGIVIPLHELRIMFSRSGGPGGQHVNRTETRVTIIWNMKNSAALNEQQKQRIFNSLGSRITEAGDIIIHNNESRSQQQNKENAFNNFVALIGQALKVPKKRMKTHISKVAKEARLQEKSRHSDIKKMRSKKFSLDD